MHSAKVATRSGKHRKCGVCFFKETLVRIKLLLDPASVKMLKEISAALSALTGSTRTTGRLCDKLSPTIVNQVAYKPTVALIPTVLLSPGGSVNQP